QKSTISSIVGLAGTVLSATTGDVATTVQSGQVAQNAVENNEFSIVTDAANKQAGKSIALKRAECQANGINPNSSACGQYHDKKLRKDASNTLGNLSDGATAAGVGCLYAVVCSEFSPGLFLIGKGAGWGSTLLDTEKSMEQKILEAGVSWGFSIASAKTLENVSEIHKAVKKAHEEISSKLGEKAVGAGYECKNNPNQIGCGSKK
uniref:VENN motif pre-toxin domain-containing protein n=1 Tax=Acinetobacter soli TaxID=487316 RepID=UPI001D17FA1C